MFSTFSLSVQDLRNPDVIHSLQVRWYTSIKDVKDMMRKITNVLPSKQEFFYASFPKALRNQTTMHDLGFEGAGNVLGVSLAATSPNDNRACFIAPVKNFPDIACQKLVSDVRLGFYRGQTPSKTDIFDGTGGVYFMRGSNGVHNAVFKPRDEEQGMPMNPKDHTGNGLDGLRPHFRPGEGYAREFAAYLFDFNNFIGVPHTVLVHCENPIFKYESRITSPKLGSLQAFVDGIGTFEDFHETSFSDFEVQKIALFDMRLLNNDRNSANILVTQRANSSTGSHRLRANHPRSESLGSQTSSRGSSSGWDDGNDEDGDQYMDFDDDFDKVAANACHGQFGHLTLVPIDHGYSFPPRLQISEVDWVWFLCPQLTREVHPQLQAYIKSIDIDAAIENLRTQTILSNESLFLVRITHELLLQGITRGLNLNDIACMIARPNDDIISPLEKLIAMAEENAFRMIELTKHARSCNLTAPFDDVRRRGCSPSRFKSRPTKSLSNSTREHSNQKGGSMASENLSVLTSSRSFHCPRDTWMSCPTTPITKNSAPVSRTNSNSCINIETDNATERNGEDDEAKRIRGYSNITLGEDDDAVFDESFRNAIKKLKVMAVPAINDDEDEQSHMLAIATDFLAPLQSPPIYHKCSVDTAPGITLGMSQLSWDNSEKFRSCGNHYKTGMSLNMDLSVDSGNGSVHPLSLEILTTQNSDNADTNSEICNSDSPASTLAHSPESGNFAMLDHPCCEALFTVRNSDTQKMDWAPGASPVTVLSLQGGLPISVLRGQQLQRQVQKYLHFEDPVTDEEPQLDIELYKEVPMVDKLVDLVTPLSLARVSSFSSFNTEENGFSAKTGHKLPFNVTTSRIKLQSGPEFLRLRQLMALKMVTEMVTRELKKKK